MNEGHKKAALRIHSLSESDQQWIIGNLPEKERDLLSDLLLQLSAMQVPKNNLVFSELIDNATAAHASVMAEELEGSSSISRTIDGADPAIVATILLREPDWLVALVLMSGEWSWSEDCIDRLSAERPERLHILIGRMSGRIQPKLKYAVTNLLANALQMQPDKPLNNVCSRFDALFEKNRTPSGAALTPADAEAML